jgi:hypothetical protein
MGDAGDQDGSFPPGDGGTEDPNPDGGPTGDAQPTGDATPTADGPVLTAVGGTCTTDADCAEGLCGDGSVLPAITGPSARCTRMCCRSEDCPSGFVCYGNGAGGSYCVDPHPLGRTALGPASGGSPCETNADCRSGICANNVCADACCSNTDCRMPNRCIDQTLEQNGPHFFSCGVGGAARVGQFCGASRECRSNLCTLEPGDTFARCFEHGCNAAYCTDHGYGDLPLYLPADATRLNGDQVLVCASAVGQVGTGQACAHDSDCMTNLCDLAAKTCADPCCVSTDCPSGQVCRLLPGDAPRRLRCTTP